ncbi:DUF5343 domain-containing protein [Pantoea ananatis]|jgi:hypothetical protein|uniref:DUF5343 domain-containing protein n=1 Tax=Pantoea ananas TaxID=553 RepID=UPI0007630258|nr:DUF5343 domain-containing protein [Pantoea ananatis]AMB76597.1 hypothetical protein AW734_18375 [Pantoea ananatis]
MAKNHPAFMNATGTIGKILEKIKVAATPERFTQDFLSTGLGFSGGGAKAFIPLAKKMGLLASDGTPTELYKQFRNTNTSTSKAAMGKALKNAYPDIYARNEYAHKLSKQDLEGLLVEMTGLEKGNSTVRAIIGTFEAIRAFASFEPVRELTAESESSIENIDRIVDIPSEDYEPNLKLGLSYTINLVLPKTDDVAVFNSIFKSLRENLLRK